MHPVPARILLLLLFFSPLVAAANFAQCLQDFRNDPNGIGGVDSRGQPASSASAVGLTYGACTARCGSDAESFSWREFTQSFSLWLLPWLVLISQLPFGSGHRVDDLLSVVMSVGSPALAAYSLLLTALNARSVYRRVQHIRDGSRNTVARALVSLQQVPLELTKDARLLAFISVGDQWRQEIVDRLNQRNAWSIDTGSSVAWVIIAFVFTLVNSFVSLDKSSIASEGHAVGILWLWLLCLVIGWFWVPTFTCGELRSAVGFVNQKAARKAARRIRIGAHRVVNYTRAKFTGLSRRARRARPVTDFVHEENEKVKEGSVQEGTKPIGQELGAKANPLLNPSHNQSTVSFQLLPESHHGYDQRSASADLATNQSIVSMARSAAGYSIAQSSIRPDRDRLLISKDPFNSLNRDEFRLAATFNYSRIMGYLALVDDVLIALDNLTNEKHKKNWGIFEARPTGVFPPGALNSMLTASIFALVLQCGTTAAAAIVAVFTPTVGLGCRSLGYILYGGIALLILFLTIISTLLARISETRNERSTIVKGFTAFIATAFHKISHLLAFINVTGLILLSCFQFSNFLDNCYCNASVIGRGTDSYVAGSYEGWIPTMRNSRIGATILAASSVSIYMFFLWLISTPPPAVDDL